MSDRPPGPVPLRGGRSVVFAVATTALGAGAHTAAGGGTPDRAVLVAALVVLALGAHVLTERERGLPAVVAGVAASQAGLHVALLGHHHAGPGAAAVPLGGLSMTGAHAVAVLALACWLRRGEAALWAAARRVGAAVLALPAPPAAPLPGAPQRTVPVTRRPAVAAPLLLLLAHGRRGPPAAQPVPLQ